MTWFARILAYHPFVVLSAVTVLCSTCIVISLTTIRLPNFKEPQLGFEARGTDISQRLTAWDNLRESLQPSGPLTVSPVLSNTIKHKTKASTSAEINVQNESILDNVINGYNMSNISFALESATTGNNNFSNSSPVTEDEDWETLISRLDSDHRSSHQHHHHHQSESEYFCSNPAAEYGRIVVTGSDRVDLFAVSSLLTMCRLESLITTPDLYKSICATTSVDQKLCKPWSLPNYITMISNKTTCLDITEEDVDKVKKLLEYCRHYKDLSCVNWILEMPTICDKCRHMFDLIQYILDYEFVNQTDSLKNVLIMLPIARSTAALPYYHVLEKMKLSMGDIQVTAVDFGLKNALFDEQLLEDTRLIAAGGVLVLVCMWIYTRSFFITVMTVIAIAFSLGVAYFMYVLILEINFFPFMNLLAVVVAVGIGGDTSLMIYKVWTCAKQYHEPSKSFAKLVHSVHSHSSICLVVTSLTTAFAFYSSYVSNITAICCFSVFAGTAVLTNLMVMMGWLPATLVVAEKIPSCQRGRQHPRSNHSYNMEDSSLSTSRLSQLLVAAVIGYPLLWIVILALPVLMAPIILFYRPGLRLPDTPDLQLFASNHLFEQYDSVYKHRFWFDRMQKLEGWPDPLLELPLRFVWGVLPVDNGDHNDPSSRGSLQWDKSFDIAARDSQVWLMSFCSKLRSQPFFKPTGGPLLSNCFLENFIEWMKRKCDDPIDKLSRAPCCESARFPYSRKVFSTCLALAANSLYNTPAQLIASDVAGPKFAKKTRSGLPKVKALVVEYYSNYSLTTSFKEMDYFFKQVESWTQAEMASAPLGMRNGWFVSHLSLYDVQRSLARETVAAIIISTISSLVVVCLTTRDLILSIAASITVASIILVTVAILVLFGWKLNIIEAVAISLAIGLAVDFSIHYVINYRLAPENSNRIEAVRYSLSMMSGPTIMAAFTTAATGILMSPSSVLAYRQIGIFLIVVMCVSWVYASFFLMSLLTLFGPNIKKQRKSDRCTNIGVEIGDGVLVGSSCGVDGPVLGEQHELTGMQARESGNRRAADNSPSAASATTILHDDDCELPVMAPS
ncbi:RND transporter family member dispatched isoform X1 [Rhodnius prolixus]|uniref:RND transporter family member dispatched isoform X1 n=2 Tax=Rhodnius prolixus TaxID=13249 RepID=UPI003D189C33